MFYYYLTERELTAGEIVEPGRYGRTVMQVGSAHGAYRREMAYEAIRASHFPDRPSRLSCFFCFLTFEEAQLFRTHIKGFENSILYEVESDENYPHVADTNNDLQHQDLPAFNAGIIARYWQGWRQSSDPKAVVLREALLRNPVKVVRKIERSPT